MIAGAVVGATPVNLRRDPQSINITMQLKVMHLNIRSDLLTLRVLGYYLPVVQTFTPLKTTLVMMGEGFEAG